MAQAARSDPQPAEISEAVKLWERVMEIDRYAPSAEQRWNALVYANAHGISQGEALVILKGGRA
jgi:hypothetical protein